MADINIPRNPSYYSPSTHAKQQRKHRDIPWELVAETIETGELIGDHRQDCEKFIEEFEGVDLPVCVVVNYEMGVVITVEWRYE